MRISKLPVQVALIGSMFAGALVATQSRLNGGLSTELGDGFIAAAISFGSGLVILTVLVLWAPSAREGLGRLGTDVREGRYPVWGLAGGACGGYFVLTQGLVASLLGLALFTVGVVAGQVLGGLAMDRLGMGPGGRIDPTVPRLVGTSLAIVAVIVSVLGDVGHAGSVLLILLPLSAGFGIAFQTALNGLVRASARSALAATFVNFVIGTAILAWPP